MLHSAGSAIFLAAGSGGPEPLPAAQSRKREARRKTIGSQGQDNRSTQSRVFSGGGGRETETQSAGSCSVEAHFRSIMAAMAAAAAARSGAAEVPRFPSRWPAQTPGSGETLEIRKMAHSFLLGESGRCSLSPHPATCLLSCRLAGDLPATPKAANPRSSAGVGGAPEHCAGVHTRAPPATNPGSRQAKPLPINPVFIS